MIFISQAQAYRIILIIPRSSEQVLIRTEHNLYQSPFVVTTISPLEIIDLVSHPTIARVHQKLHDVRSLRRQCSY